MENINRVIRSWTKSNQKDLDAQWDKLNIKHRSTSKSTKSSRDQLKNAFSSRQGVIYKIGIKFPRHMIFVHKGVGNGTKAGEQGKSSRKEKPWFNPVVDKNIEDLADAVAEAAADMIVTNLRIR